MQTIELAVKNKVLSFVEGSRRSFLVSDNNDYQMHIDLDDRRNAMFAVFVRGGQGVRCVIDSEGYVLNDQNERGVPAWALCAPELTVGVVSDGYATTPLTCAVFNSIQTQFSEEAVLPDDPLVEQLIAIVNAINLNAQTVIDMAQAAEAYAASAQASMARSGYLSVELTDGELVISIINMENLRAEIDSEERLVLFYECEQ